MTVTVQTDTPDWALIENAKARAHRGTHLAPDAPSGALFVSRGTSTLGDGQGALSVRAGAAFVDGDRQTVDSDTAMDIRGGDGQPRRDVVYLTDSGSLDVIEGTPAAFVWGDGLSEEEQTIANAHRPAPPDMADIVGYPLAVVTVTPNANSLSAQAVHELRAAAPVGAVSADGKVRSSDYGTVQAALDAAAGGELFIDDTKTEEGIGIGSEHSGTTIRCVGGHGIQQPTSPTMNIPVMHRKDGNSGPVEDMTFVDLYIFNPTNTRDDIYNRLTFDDTSAPNRNWPAFRWHASPLSGSGGMARFKFIRPRIENINGFGICCREVIGSVHIIDGSVKNTMYDAYYTRVDSDDTDPEPHIEYRGCTSDYSGRHNFCIAGDSTANSAYISGWGDMAYTSGVDIEHANNVTLSVTVRESGRTTQDEGGNVSALHSGIYVSHPSSNVGGRIRVIDPEGYAAYLKSPPDGLTISHEETRGGASPGGTPPIWLDQFEGGELTVSSEGGGTASDGSSASGVVYLNEIDNCSLHGTIRQAWGNALGVDSSARNDIDIVSAHPFESGSLADSAHITLRGTDPTHNDIHVVADGATPEYVINAVSADADYNRYTGIAAGAFASSATTGTGTESDASGLL